MSKLQEPVTVRPGDRQLTATPVPNRRDRHLGLTLSACLLSTLWFIAAWRFAYENCFSADLDRVGILILAPGVGMPMVSAFFVLLAAGVLPLAAVGGVIRRFSPPFARALLGCIIIWAAVVTILFAIVRTLPGPPGP